MRRLSWQSLQLISTLLLLTVPYGFWLGQGAALTLDSRSISINTATPGATAAHSFQMTLVSSGNLGSIVFEYCANSPLLSDPCTAPAGLSVTNASLASQSGNSGFSIDAVDTTANRLVISRLASPAVDTASQYTFNNVVNPTGNNQTTYVRLSTYSSVNGQGGYSDSGGVAFTTVSPFSVDAYVPPFLNFCSGVSVAANCSQASGDSLDLGVLSSALTRAGTSQLAVSTNSDTGCSIFVLGTTMTSGNNVISPAGGATSQPGVNQFGLNLRRNNRPLVGADPDGNGTVTPSSGYGAPDQFSFSPGAMVAGSAVSTAYSRLTASYMVNVSASQPPGIYTTTLTYLASAQF